MFVQVPEGDWFCSDCRPKETRRSERRRKPVIVEEEEDEESGDEEENENGEEEEEESDEESDSDDDDEEEESGMRTILSFSGDVQTAHLCSPSRVHAGHGKNRFS